MAALYNATGAVRTLVGNWQEEGVLLEQAGETTKLTAAHNAASPEAPVSTRERVINHSDNVPPSEWQSHTRATFQVPVAAQYPKTQDGPRRVQELQALWQQAQVGTKPTAPTGGYETTYRAEFDHKPAGGTRVGARVMPPTGCCPGSCAVRRDPVWLQESGISPAAGRLMMAGGGGAATVAGAASLVAGGGVPLTIYSEAAAKATYCGTFYGTATLGKPTGALMMARNDQFTKPMGDANKVQEGL